MEIENIEETCCFSFDKCCMYLHYVVVAKKLLVKPVLLPPSICVPSEQLLEPKVTVKLGSGVTIIIISMEPTLKQVGYARLDLRTRTILVLLM